MLSNLTITACGTADHGDEPLWTDWFLLEPTDLPREDILDELELEAFSTGPGGQFARRPHIRRTASRVLVTQDYGLDV